MRATFIILVLSLSLLLRANNNNENGYATISGYIKDIKGEELIGANVFVKNKNLGTVSNPYGFYSLTLPKGEYVITYSFIGYNAIEQSLTLNQNKSIDVKLEPKTRTIEEVSVSAVRKDVNVTDVAMSNVKLQTRQIKKIPVLFGELDIIKAVQLLPGVQTLGEGNSGFFVRGGSVDQNLIILDDATVYNPSHIGGLFSVFNGDALKSVELFKGGIPSSYGGRLSSVLDVRMKEGNMSKISGNGGIGAISSRLTVEGPIVQNKSSFIVSGRRTYADLFFPFSNNEGLRKSKMYFYDLNGKVNWFVNKNNRVFLSAYTGRDVAQLDSLFSMEYGNITLTGRWNHVYNSKLFSNVTLIYSDFDYELGQPSGPFSFTWKANVIDKSIKNDYTLYMNPKNTIRFGIQGIHHTIKPGRAETSEESFFTIESLENNYALEGAAFLENEQKITDRLTLRYGLRFSGFSNLGKGTVYNYVTDDYGEMIPSDSTVYPSNELFNPEWGIEPRVSARYMINSQSSVKACYDRTYQYIHLATNTAASTPVDVWFVSNPNIEPQSADQVAAGYFRNINNNMYETSVEVYYKKMHNAIDFVDHAHLLLNPYFDGEMRSGKAYSYGVEFFVKKQRGQYTGWLSYTYSKTRRKIEGINNGEEYNAPYDRPHDIKFVGVYDLNEKWSFGGSWVYSSPLPYTIATEWYKHGNLWVPIYTDRNEVRLKGTGYHRLDLSVTYNLNKIGKYESNLQVSVYNCYNRHNLYSILYQQPKGEDRPPQMKKMYLFGTIPTITYNFNF